MMNKLDGKETNKQLALKLGWVDPVPHDLVTIQVNNVVLKVRPPNCLKIAGQLLKCHKSNKGSYKHVKDSLVFPRPESQLTIGSYIRKFETTNPSYFNILPYDIEMLSKQKWSTYENGATDFEVICEIVE